MLNASIGRLSRRESLKCTGKLSNQSGAQGRDLVTICVLPYRRPSLLPHALHSCLIQDYRPLEIDIGDDSPNDDCERIAASLTLPPGITLRYFNNRPALKQAVNVNALFAHARGKRLVLLHDDDVLLPGMISALNAAWTMAPDVVAAYCMQSVLYGSGELSPADTANHNAHANRTSAYCGLARDRLVRAFWRQFPNNGFVGDACDLDLGIRLALRARGKSFGFIESVTSEYCMNAGGLNKAGDSSWKIYDSIAGLTGRHPRETAARDLLLQKIASMCVS